MKTIRLSIFLLFVTLVTASWTSFPEGPNNLAHFGDRLAGDMSEGDKLVYLVRHGETCSEQGSNPNLSAYGQERARELARVLVEVNLDLIYSTPLNRTLQTATPVSQSQEIEITQLTLGSGFLEALAEEIRSSEASYILVSGHSNTTPALINLLVGTELSALEETEFDRFYVVTLHADGTGSYTVLRYGGASGSPSAC